MEVWDNGDVFEGYIVNGEKNGRGRMIYEDGTVYVGTWKNDKYHGYGTETDTGAGYSYAGEWSEDKKHGQGVLIDKSRGIYYDGTFSEDRFDGQGIRFWPTGDKYTGQWKSGKRHGNGIYTSKITKCGKWKNDFLTGHY